MVTQPTRLVVPLVLCILLAPPATAQDEGVFEGHPTDFLPLQVGNQWTYKHAYRNSFYNRFEIVEGVVREIDVWGPEQEYDPLGLEWMRIRAAWEIPGYPLTDRYEPESPLFDFFSFGYSVHELTLEITHTETVEGHAYFVFSEPPDWPPVPTLCLAGQKVRFSDAGVLLVRRQEQDIPLYDFAPPYTPFTDPTYTTKDYTTPAYPVLYDAYAPVSLPLIIRRFLLFDRAFVTLFSVDVHDFPSLRDLGRDLGYVHFLANYGPAKYEILEFGTGEIPICDNTLYPVSAVIDGQVIEHPYPYPGYTHVQPTSWGQVKAGLTP